METMQLEDIIAATVPQENAPMADLVEGSQRGNTGSGWPIYQGESNYDAATKTLRLHHSSDDYCKTNSSGVPEGIRAYIKDIIASLKCHMDVQMADDAGLLLSRAESCIADVLLTDA